MLKKFKGFLLLEVVFSIFIIGFFSSGIIFFNKQLQKKNRSINTLNKANYIRKAVEGYVARYGYLPYAAEKNGISVGGKISGYLPYKTLGISKIYAKDGFNKYFQYVVNENLAFNKSQIEQKKIYFLPPFLKQNIFPPCDKENRRPKSLCRLYEIEVKEKKYVTYTSSIEILKKYDDVDEEKNLILLRNGRKVKLSVIKILPQIENLTLLNVGNFEFLYKKEAEVSSDLVAWALISFHKNVGFENENKGKNIVNLDKNLVFWQSRFNIAANLGYPCTSQFVNNKIV